MSKFVTQTYYLNMEHPSRWYAVCTKSRFEKKLAEKLNSKGIEAYTPVRKTLKQWSDRKKWVDEVLIRSYVFVRITPLQYDTVLNTPGAVRMCGWKASPPHPRYADKVVENYCRNRYGNHWKFPLTCPPEPRSG